MYVNLLITQNGLLMYLFFCPEGASPLFLFTPTKSFSHSRYLAAVLSPAKKVMNC
jgi:hypothetical protein